MSLQGWLSFQVPSILISATICGQAHRNYEQGWKVIANPPINFRRARGMQSLPIPARDGSIEELRPFLNVGSEYDFVLCVSWLVAALNAQGPFR